MLLEHTNKDKNTGDCFALDCGVKFTDYILWTTEQILSAARAVRMIQNSAARAVRMIQLLSHAGWMYLISPAAARAVRMKIYMPKDFTTLHNRVTIMNRFTMKRKPCRNNIILLPQSQVTLRSIYYPLVLAPF